MNGPLLAATILAVVLTFAHGVGGHVFNLRPLWKGTLGDGEKLELHAVWHLYSWQLALSALALAALVAGIVPASRPLAAYLALTFVGGAIVIFTTAARRGLRELVRHPQWIFLGLLGALAWWGR